MIDNFSILLSHSLLLLAFWLISRRSDIDVEAAPAPDAEPEGYLKRKARSGGQHSFAGDSNDA